MINKVNAWDQKTEIGIMEGPVEEVSLQEKTSAMKKVKLGKTSGLSEVSMEMIKASGKVVIDVMINFFSEYMIGKECQKIGRRV